MFVPEICEHYCSDNEEIIQEWLIFVVKQVSIEDLRFGLVVEGALYVGVLSREGNECGICWTGEKHNII